jgi:hypothetical protein
MTRRIPLVVSLAAFALTLAPALVFARAGTTLYLGGGATGTTSTTSPFQGGWGVGATLEIPATRAADFIVRADYHAIPRESAGFIDPIRRATAVGNLFGDWPSGAERGSVYGLLAGLRLHSPAQRIGTYLDLMVGVGHAQFTVERDNPFPLIYGRTTSHDDTNVALSFGSGVRFNALGPGTTFIDAHFEFYFVGDREGALVPIRLGYGIPI